MKIEANTPHELNLIPYSLIGELVQKLTAKDWVDLYEKSIKPK